MEVARLRRSNGLINHWNLFQMIGQILVGNSSILYDLPVGSERVGGVVGSDIMVFFGLYKNTFFV